MGARGPTRDEQLLTGPGSPDPSTPFATSIGGLTSFRTGPDGDLYAADFFSGSIWHLGYTPPTVGPTLSPIALHYIGMGGPFSFLGEPIGPEVDVAGGRVQPFQGGTIFWSAATGAHEVHGAIRAVYESLGGPSSVGFPTTDESATWFGRGRYNAFESGSIYWTPTTGAHDVRGPIRDEWSVLGWEFGFLGYPVTGDSPTFVGNGRFTHFEGGSVYWSAATGAHEVHGAIREKWSSLGWEFGFLGFPTSDETASAGGGRFNTFAGGSVYWSAATGAHEVHGAIGATYASLGGPASSLGYPVTDETGFFLGDGRISVFERGWIFWSSTTGVLTG